MHDEQYVKQVQDLLQVALYGYIDPAKGLHEHFSIIFKELFKSVDAVAGIIQVTLSGDRTSYFGYTPDSGFLSWEPNETIKCPSFIHTIISGFPLQRFGSDSVYVVEQSKTVYAQLLDDQKYLGYLAIQVTAPTECTVSIITSFAEHVVQCINQHALFARLMFREKTTLLEKVLATLIHDIKNPLSGISGFVQLIDQKSDDDDIKKFCGIILDSLAQLSDIFTQFNAIVSGRVSPLKKSKLLVSEFINDIVDSVRETYSFNGITVTSLCEEGLVVAGEKAKLGAVFKYILKNAKEAMPEGGTVTIQAKKENGEVFFSVSDTGKGIPALMQDSVFEPFVSYDKENAAGLGLAMARKIIKDHGGTISVTSFLGKGTLFTIHLPMLPKEAAP